MEAENAISNCEKVATTSVIKSKEPSDYISIMPTLITSNSGHGLTILSPHEHPVDSNHWPSIT